MVFKSSRTDGPSYQSHTLFGSLASILRLSTESIGNISTLGYLQTFFKYGKIEFLMKSYLSLDHLVNPILVTTQIRVVTPRALAKRACSLVCPSFSNPDSNYPTFDDKMRIAKSA